MTAILERTIQIGADRRVSLEFSAPESVPTGEARVILRFENGAETDAGASASEKDDALARILSHTFPAIEALKAEAARKAKEQQAYFEAAGRDWFEDVRASFKSTPFEGIDGVEYQRSMRDEWPD